MKLMQNAMALARFYALTLGRKIRDGANGAWSGPRLGRGSSGPRYERVAYGNGILQTYGRTEAPEGPKERRKTRRRLKASGKQV